MISEKLSSKNSLTLNIKPLLYITKTLLKFCLLMSLMFSLPPIFMETRTLLQLKLNILPFKHFFIMSGITWTKNSNLKTSRLLKNTKNLTKLLKIEKKFLMKLLKKYYTKSKKLNMNTLSWMIKSSIKNKMNTLLIYLWATKLYLPTL